MAPIGHRHQTTPLVTLENCPIWLGHEQVDDAAPLIKSENQRVQRDYSDALNEQQLELWPDSD